MIKKVSYVSHHLDEIIWIKQLLLSVKIPENLTLLILPSAQKSYRYQVG